MTSAAHFVFENRPDDIASMKLEVEGRMPEAIRGRFLANGPGRNQIGGQKLHAFDAYGRIVSASFSDGAVVLQGKHVDTPLLKEENFRRSTPS